MACSASCRQVTHAGLAAFELQLPCGDRLVVAEQGAQVLSWVAAGRERLYMSPRSALDGQTAIRGGVPVCFPQFNQRGPAAGLPKHGFARNLPWTAQPARLEPDGAQLQLELHDSERSRAWWPQAFEVQLDLQLSPGSLGLVLTVRNTGTQPWAFTGALHTYFAVDDVARVQLSGLGGCAEWDSVADRHAAAAPVLRIEGEFDRVYTATATAYELRDGPHRLAITQSPSWANTVVWNPGEERCATLADMPEEGWQRMLCVEAAQVLAPITLAAGGLWQGAQQLRVG
jgi:glucose-6-phosphate 1-epimerase